MKTRNNSEQGFTFLMVMLVMLILCATILAISVGLRTQSGTAYMATNSSVALAKAEDGIAMGLRNRIAGWKSNSSFKLNDNGWAVTVTYTQGNNTVNPPILDRITAIATLGKVSRTVTVDVGNAPNPFNQYSFYSGGTLNLTNGSYDICGNHMYAEQRINIDASAGAIHSSKDGATLESAGTVNYPSWAPMQKITALPGVASPSIPGVDWEAFASSSKVVKTYTNVKSDLDISNDVLNAKGGYVIVRVTGGNPTIYTTSKDFSGTDCTIVIIKDNASANPTLEIKNGSYGNKSNPINLSAFVDGEIKTSSLCYSSKGVFYATGKVTIQNGTYGITGGVTSLGNIDVNSVDFSFYDPQWGNYTPFFKLAPAITNWREQ